MWPASLPLTEIELSAEAGGRDVSGVWPRLRDSASLAEVTVTQACPALFTLSDSFWDMQGPHAVLANTEESVMFTLYIQESA